MSVTPKPKPKLSYKAQSYPSIDKPFECTACQLYFRRLHDLKRHERLHTGERPYCCNNCRRTFARLDALKRHLSAESNVHCSEWTYQPGLISTVSRPAARHHRSVSLPHVQGSDVQTAFHDQFDSVERTLTTPTLKDRPPSHYHYHHHEHSSPESTIHGHHPEDKPNDYYQENATPHAFAVTEEQRRQCLSVWEIHSKRSSPEHGGRLSPSDATIDEDTTVIDQPRPRAHTSSFDSMQLSSAHQPYPHAYSRQHTRSYSHQQNSYLDPHPQHPLSLFDRSQPQQRHESYPVSPSRSTLSPSPPPGLSPSMSASSLSSPTNVWSYSRGYDGNETTAPKRIGSNAFSHYDSRSQFKSEPTSISARMSSSAYREPSPYQEDDTSQGCRSPRELEHRQGPSSLALILNNPPVSNFTITANQASSPPPVPALSSRPVQPHSSHSQSHPYSLPQQPQQPHHRYVQQCSSQQEHEHSCDAMAEIQKLRQELRLVTMRCHSLEKERTRQTNINGISGNSTGMNGGDSRDDRSVMSV
ncbi:hypothetical protein BX616_009811 [Lobosporangium transversale]|uniref:C2H2-type domain-containing protein n=1 Tax=Lobosporangium transversale TaxID=64571 RepID=A0A1Y2GEM8_9FUNG|nr:hypothetical protein BCR41DRAFT_388976 [Lobosporangium transversale]KAF9913619.1 hypothetical protein BX616_009811 [Lobosporangium transversale]ORZ07286.1 hypothetical protein BCR41DRAFT_388976 [Lobosporangium transversale]|eukprot:XP_021877949.1 hypothetical protein BCR41DRAFT_388976 [Lobosporangium transversale]